MRNVASSVRDSGQSGQAPDLQLLIDSTPGLIHTALPDGYIDFFNETWLKYVGRALEDLQGWKWTAAIHPDDVEGIVEKWRASLASGEPFLYETRVLRADGEYRWMLHHKIALRDDHGKIVKWYGSSIDIEERKRAEERIRSDERELRQLIDYLPQHVMVLDADGRLLHANQMVLDYIGRTLKDMQEADSRERIERDIHPDDLERAQRERQAGISNGAAFEIERRVLGKNGEYRWFLFRYRPLIDEAGRVARWFLTATDIEDRKLTEERLRHENVALREEIDKTSMFEEIVGNSPALQAVLSRVSKVAPTDSTVLVAGETGTGKELVARAIHRRSNRASRAFVSVNCAAIPRDL